MNPITEALLLQLTAMCLRINSQGQWHVFLSLSGHVRLIEVYIHRSDTEYRTGIDRERLLSASFYYQGNPRYYDCELTADAEAKQKLQALLSELETFMQPEQQGAAA